MKVNVNIPTDFTVGVLTHFQWAPPLPLPAPTPMVSIEIPATQLWTLGYACKQNKWTDTGKQVLHKGLYVMLENHNTGMMIPDLTVPPAPNMQYPIMWPFSSRKVNFSASTVKMHKISVGCSQLLGLPPIPQMTCGDPMSAPTCFSMITITNTLSVGMTVLDFIIGVAACAISMVIDYVLSKVFPQSPGKAGVTAAKRIADGIIGKMIPFKNAGQTWKRGLGALGNFAIAVARGEPHAKLVVFGGKDGGPPGLEIQYKHSEDGTNTAGIRVPVLGVPDPLTTSWGGP